MNWNPNNQLSQLPKDILKKFADFADFLYQDLKINRLEVVLIPAPDPQFSGHKIRVVNNRNSGWYSNLYWSYSNLKRKRLMKALDMLRKTQDKDFRINKSGRYAFHIYNYSYHLLCRELIFDMLTEGYLDGSERIFPNNSIRSFFGMDTIEEEF